MCNLSGSPHSSIEKDYSLSHACVSYIMGNMVEFITKNMPFMLSELMKMSKPRLSTTSSKSVLTQLSGCRRSSANAKDIPGTSYHPEFVNQQTPPCRFPSSHRQFNNKYIIYSTMTYIGMLKVWFSIKV